MSGPASSASSDRFRPDIQGLRAIAVLLVVLFHLWPNRLTGGFIGVDVFFVISGYLITRHLAEEVDRHGRVRVVAFWARRARRLLPAAFVVLLASLVAVRALVPATLWLDTVGQVRAAAFYVLNWTLAADAVDYSASRSAPTVAQHYWSLSVEEQFYLVWPLLIGALLLVAAGIRRRGRRSLSARRVMFAGLVVVAALSLVWSVLLTAEDRSVAYFVTTTRAWEFALGGLLGLLWRPGLVPRRLAPAVAWGGLVMIAIAGVRFSDQTAFPGWVALLPVLGTVAVLAAPDGGRVGPQHFLASSPARFLGDISYAFYLWHWPLIVIAPHVVDGFTAGAKVAVFCLSVLLAWGTTRLVEAPLRSGPLLRRTPAALGFAAAGMALVMVVSPIVLDTGESNTRLVAAQTTRGCIGPGALDPANDCGPVLGTRKPAPGPVAVMRQNRERIAYPGCQAEAPGSELVSCTLGVAPDQAARSVAIVGDSHATQWFPALDLLGEQHDWTVRTYTKSGCPVTMARRVIPGETAAGWQADCARWGRRVLRALTRDGELDAVFVAAYSTAYRFISPPGEPLERPAIDGFRAAWADLVRAGLPVLAFEEVPRTQGDYVPTCLAEHDDPMACAVGRSEAMPTRRALSSAARSAPGVSLIRLIDQFCDDRWCYPVVGSMLVYRDYSHIARDYARALVPFIDRQLPAAILGR